MKDTEGEIGFETSPNRNPEEKGKQIEEIHSEAGGSQTKKPTRLLIERGPKGEGKQLGSIGKRPRDDEKASPIQPSKKPKKGADSKDREAIVLDSDSEPDLPPIEDVMNLTKEEFEKLMK